MFDTYYVVFCEGNEKEIQDYLINMLDFSWYFGIDKNVFGNPIHEEAEVLILTDDKKMERHKKLSHFQTKFDYLVYKDSLIEKCVYGSNPNWKEEINSIFDIPKVTAEKLKRELSKNSPKTEVIIILDDKEYKISDIEDIYSENGDKIALICEEN